VSRTPPDPRDTVHVKGYLAALIRCADPAIIARAHKIFGGGRLSAIPQLREILDELDALAKERLPIGESELLLLATRLAARDPGRGDAEDWLKVLQDLMKLPSQPSWIGWMEAKHLEAVIVHELRRVKESGLTDMKPGSMGRLLERLTADVQMVRLGSPEETDEPMIVRLSDVAPEEVKWLWPPYIAIGKLTFLEGDPDLGKTWFSLYVAAIVSRGWPLPDSAGFPGPSGQPGDVVYLSAEDGAADTLRPRLDAIGADVSRIHVLPGILKTNRVTGKKELVTITLSDLPVLEAALSKIRPVLLVVDPIQAYMGSKVDMWRPNQVRPVLAGLASLIERYQSASLCIRHLTKDAKTKALYRGLGSIDFAAAARSILIVGLDPQRPDRRVVAHLKSNLAPKGSSFSYELREGQFLWTGPSKLTASSLCKSEPTGEQQGALEEAVCFLTDALAAGPKPVEQVRAEAKKAGITPATLRRARIAVGVGSRRISIPGGKPGEGEWHWFLREVHPPEESPPYPDEHLENASQTLDPKEDPERIQDDQMSTLIDSENDQGDHLSTLNEQGNLFEEQGVTTRIQDDHRSVPGGSDDDSEFI
jgi:AAA domain-containing protein